MQGHPIQKPLVRVILHIDFDIDQKPAAKESCAMTNTSTSKRRGSSKTGKPETL